jgi:hypothetical protein
LEDLMATEDFTRAGDILKFGDDKVRVEAGWRRVTAKATEELLDDKATHPDYFVGTRPQTFNGPNGPITIEAPGRDSLGEEIKLGQKMTYLDRGGSENAGAKDFLIFKRVPIDPTAEKLESGLPNPHYVPEHVRKGALLEAETPPNRTAYEYVFDVADTVPIGDYLDPESYAEAEAEAINRARAVLADMEA